MKKREMFCLTPSMKCQIICGFFLTSFPSADVVKDKSHVMYEGKHIHFSEVDNKPLCSYSPKLCKQRRLNGYAFCIRHVLEDKTAPFKQCEYVAKYNSQRCTNPIPKSEDRRWVCVWLWHSPLHCVFQKFPVCLVWEFLFVFQIL